MILTFLYTFLFCFAWAGQVGGADPFTTPDRTRNAFGHPFPRLTREERRTFFVGNSFFKQNWVRAPSTTTARDGLGPTFNAVSCSACHSLDGRGPGADREGFPHVSLLFRIDKTVEYGAQLQPLAIEGVEREVRPDIRFTYTSGSFKDGEVYVLRRPDFTFTDWLLGAPLSHTRVSARVGNQLIGLGLLEAIPESEILARADPDDLNGDRISGRAARVYDVKTGQLTLGRFGWKAEQPSVEQQSAAAFNGDIGLTSSLFPEQNCPAPQLACQQALPGGEPEVEPRVLEALSFYMRSIAVPTPRAPDDPDTAHGGRIFKALGCASCHHPSYQVDGVAIFPYTDLLLHDMGKGLADRALGGAWLDTEWRTPPLWGIGLIPTVNGHMNLLHDGRARGVSEAILWHGGEALRAREEYKRLTARERAQLVRFVESL